MKSENDGKRTDTRERENSQHSITKENNEQIENRFVWHHLELLTPIGQWREP
jgi:hypothetical protein